MADWNPGKREANYSFTDRAFDGASAMWLRKSAEEAPGVGTYDYSQVQFEAYDSGVTSFDDFKPQWTTTLYGDKSHGKAEGSAMVDIDTLLNDAWFSVMIDEYGKLTNILERARIMGILYPADHPIKNMFGESTLWTRINDSEFKISGGTRDAATRILSGYHQS
jgi:hypothetical protein